MKVKVFGEQDWVNGVREMALAPGDQVKTDPGAGAEIAFIDGLVLKVAPETLVRVESRPLLQTGRLAFGSERKTPERPQSLSMPTLTWTDSPETKEPPAGSMTVGPSGDVIEQSRGKGRVDTASGQRVDLNANERLSTDRQGRAGPKVPIPPAPVLLAPPHLAMLSYEDLGRATTVLSWRPVSGAVTYHVMLDDDAWFTQPLMERTGIAGNSLELPGLSAGKYYWRVSAVDARKTEGAFSGFAGFTVAAAVPGPTIVIESIEVQKNVARIKGRTAPGASVTVNGQKVDVGEDGSFAEFITLPALGRQKLIFRSEDARGKVAREERSVVVESF